MPCNYLNYTKDINQLNIIYKTLNELMQNLELKLWEKKMIKNFPRKINEKLKYELKQRHLHELDIKNKLFILSFFS